MTDKIEIIRDIRYGKGVNNLFNLYIPKSIDKAKEQGVVVCIHGGGWNSFSKDDMEHECLHFSEEGYLSATIGHTFIKVNASQNPPTAAVSPEANVFIMLYDIGCAIEKIKTVTKEMGIHVTKIALSGGSSGAHLAMLYAYSRSKTAAIPVAFVCNAVGPADMRLFKSFPLPEENNYQLISALCGKEINPSNIAAKEIQQLIADISPVTFIDKNAPPTISAYGGRDPVVSIEQATAVRDEFRKSGIEYEEIIFPNSSHDLAGDSECAKRYKELELEFAKKYFN